MNWMHDLKKLLGRARRTGPEGEAPGGISCRDAAERVFEWLDGELEADMAARVGAHLETCAHCYPFLRFESAFRAAVERAVAGRDAPPCPDQVEARILASLRAEGFQGPDPPEGPGGE